MLYQYPNIICAIFISISQNSRPIVQSVITIFGTKKNGVEIQKQRTHKLLNKNEKKEIQNNIFFFS